MDRFPEYLFTLSQAPGVSLAEKQYPGLYEADVPAHPGGADWRWSVRCTLSATPLQRQISERRFLENNSSGRNSARICRWAFCGRFRIQCRPAAAVCQGGVPYFTTNKLSMNDTNRFSDIPSGGMAWMGPESDPHAAGKQLYQRFCAANDHLQGVPRYGQGRLPPEDCSFTVWETRRRSRI